MEYGKITFIFGAPRSGTTWLAKIFDSHVDTVYCHEPDLVIRSDFIPLICPKDNFAQYSEATRQFIASLFADRSLKSRGSLPVFRKSADTALQYEVRRCGLYGLKSLEKLLPAKFHHSIRVPDFTDLDGGSMHRVVKSVNALGRAGLIQHALPDCRVILIIRHAFSQVASRLKGIADNMFEKRPWGLQWIGTPQAARYGLNESLLGRLSLAEQLAWEWAVLNEKALDDLQGNPRALIFRYKDFTADPLGHSKNLFAFSGLPWCAQTERFIRRSGRPLGPDGYYRVYKDPHVAKTKWRTTLSFDEKKQIYDIMRKTSVGQLWPELIDDPDYVMAPANT